MLTYAWGAAPVEVPDGCELLVFQGKQLTHGYDVHGPCAALLNGASCVVNHAEYVWPAFTELCSQLRERLVHVYCNSYVTPPGCQAVPPHADDRDVFVIQLCGCKRWRVWGEAPVKFPYPDEQVGKSGLPIPAQVLNAKPAIECVLRPGDVLYMPRGYVHEAFCTEAASSWHATLAVATHDWSWSKILSGAVAETLDSDPSARWREAVPLGLGTSLGTRLAGGGASAEDALQEVLDFVRQSLKVSSLESRFKDKVSSHNRMQDRCSSRFAADLARFIQETGGGADSDAWPYVRPLAVTLRSRVRRASDGEREEALHLLQYAFLRSKGKGKGKGLPRLDGLVVRDEAAAAVHAAFAGLTRRGEALTVAAMGEMVLEAVDCPSFDDLTLLCVARAAVAGGMLVHADADTGPRPQARPPPAPCPRSLPGSGPWGYSAAAAARAERW